MLIIGFLYSKKRVDGSLIFESTVTVAAQNMTNTETSNPTAFPSFEGYFGEEKYTGFGRIDSQLKTVGVWQKGSGENDHNYEKNNQYKIGTIYYLKDNKIAGVLFWNMQPKLGFVNYFLQNSRTIENTNDLTRAIPWIEPFEMTPPPE